MNCRPTAAIVADLTSLAIYIFYFCYPFACEFVMC